MCGISGIINFNAEPVDRKAVANMTRLVNHRGPDGSGFYFKKNVGFGHRLLSITGCENPTQQPITDAGENYVLVFNGQVYNYKELAQELATKGYQFKTVSDTEVLLKAYMEWGDSVNERLNGMWAFVVADFARNKLFISRDRFGQKPLYYTVHHNRFIFFSEIKQLKAIADFPFRLNVAKAVNFLSHGQIDDDEFTLFENVFSLLPGECAAVDLYSGVISRRIWYSPGIQVTEQEPDPEYATQKFTELLYDSIRLRTPETVTTGAFLSGGMDSSSIIGFMHLNGLKSKLSGTLSCVIDHKSYNEEKYINLIADHYHLHPSKIKPSLDKSLSEHIDQCLYHQDQPITSICHIIEWQLFVEAERLRMKVMLDGQGADEILGGYRPFYYTKFIRSFRIRKLLSYLNVIIHKCLVRHTTSLKDELQNLLRYHPFIRRLGLVNRKLKRSEGWLLPDPASVGYSAESRFDKSNTDHLVRDMSVELLKKELPYLLHSVDRNSMAFGIETRLPFLDHRLVEFSLSLPDHLKIDSLGTKKILKESTKEILPSETLGRSKLGLSTPDGVIMKNIEPDFWELDNLYERFPGIFSKKLKEDVDKFYQGKISYNFGMFRVLSFSRWSNIFDVFSSLCIGFFLNLAA